MLTNPHTGQRVRVAVEYRDVWPAHDLGDRAGIVLGIGDFIIVKFEGRDYQTHVRAEMLEDAD